MIVQTCVVDSVGKQAAAYVHAGLRLVKLYGVRSPGVCTCSKGANCSNPGKHPIGKPWQTAADEETAFDLFGEGGTSNVGVMLGPAGKGEGPAVVDVEADDDVAAAELSRLGLDKFATPTWSSGRGLHRLFLWQEGLPGQGAMHCRGIEVRLGGDGKRTQSVMPPSTHHSGRPYAWLPGFSLDDVEIAPLPDNLLEVILAEDDTRSVVDVVDAARPARRSQEALRGPVREGGRNNALLSAAGLLARSIDPDDEDAVGGLLNVLRAVNGAHCRPPLPDDEVKAVFRQAVKYRRERDASHALMPGVAATAEGGNVIFTPDGLELWIHQGDPTLFELRGEALVPFNTQGAVTVPAEVWGDSRKMKLALIAAFPGMPVDRHPGDFKMLWEGLPRLAARGDRPARAAVPGLRVLLEEQAIAAGRRIEVTDSAANATRRLVGWAVEMFDRWEQHVPFCVRDSEAPGPNAVVADVCRTEGGFSQGGAVYSGTLYFSWEKLWRGIEHFHNPDRTDQQKLVRAINGVIGRELKQQRCQHNGPRYTFRTLTTREVALLRDFADGAAATPVDTHVGKTSAHETK